MRIAQVLHDFLPSHQAGSELYAYHLIKELQVRHEVTLFCREDGLPSISERLRVSEDRSFVESDEIYDGIPIRRLYPNSSAASELLEGSQPSRKAPGPLERFRNLYANRAVELSFNRFLDDTRPDVVHVQHLLGLSGGLIAEAKRRGLGVVVTLHDFWFQCHRIQLLRPNLARCSGPAHGLKCPGCLELGWAYPWPFALGLVTAPLFVQRTAYLQRHLALADVILSPSAFVRDLFVRNGFPADRIEVRDNGTADAWLAEFQPMNSTRLRFGFVGSVMRHKGVHVLIEAFNQLNRSEAELLVYGDPQFDPVYYAEMQALASAPGVQFRGRFANTQIAQVMAEVDVLVVPSIWYENSPVTIHEARLAGIPVIASRLGGIPELVEDGVSGFLFGAGDVLDLRVKMQRLLDEPGLLAQFRRGVRPVKTMRENARELEAIYQQLADRKRKL